MSHNKNVLFIGGPADGMRIALPMAQRSFDVASDGAPDLEYHVGQTIPVTTYALSTVQGAFHDVFHVGVLDLNTCVICELVAGYRKPRSHPTDANVAQQLVTAIGGKADGRQFALPTGRRVISPMEAGDAYHIVPVICKDGTEIRVAVLDMVSVDPIRELVAGYRMGIEQ